MNTNTKLLLPLCFLTLLIAASKVQGEKRQCSSDAEGSIRMPTLRTNSTCGFVSGEIEICSGSVWKIICDSQWTVKDATVACRELGHSVIGANVTSSGISVHRDDIAPTVPECMGDEQYISNCSQQNATTNTNSVSCKTGVMCFVNDSTPTICFKNLTTFSPTSTTATSDDTSSSGSDTTQATQSHNTAQGEQTTSTSPLSTQSTPGDGAESNFLTTPIGIGVIVVIVVIIIFFVALFILIVFVLCRRSPVKGCEQSRVSPQNVYYDDNSVKGDGDGKPFNNSPDQRRRENVPATTEHHLLEQDPLYEQLKDVAPPSVSSHDSGRSTDLSDTNPPPTLYNTLERDETLPLPTYSTLDRAQSDYAQVEPYINGSLPRGAALVSPVSDDVYHILDRTTSQSSYTREYNRSNGNASPKTSRVAGKPNSSPKQTPRSALQSISDTNEAPTYAVLEETIDEASMISSTNAVVAQKFSPHHSPAFRHSPRHSPGAMRHSPIHSPSGTRYSPSHSPAAIRHSPVTRHSPGHRGLPHNRSHTVSQTRPPTHELTALASKKKSSTLPNSGRSAPSLSHVRTHRHSDYIEEPASNGVDTFVDSRLTASTQNNTFTSWV